MDAHARRPGFLNGQPRTLRAHQRALADLVAAIARGEADAVTTILAAVTPGGGKSLLPIIAAASLIAAGRVDRIVWVVPRDSLRLQAEEAFADPLWRQLLGHSHSVRSAENAPRSQPGTVRLRDDLSGRRRSPRASPR